MTLSASPALQQIEAALQVTSGTFEKKNYRSVFDITRLSRKQFITDNIDWLGSRGGRAWDLATGQAQYIRHLFRENQLTGRVRGALRQGSAGVGGIQGLVQDGPDWQSQFAESWQAYCQSGAPEAVNSPVSYLTWLYNQAMRFEQEMTGDGDIIPLSERRPDLGSMVVDNDAINQHIPALQLVNEILGNSIAGSLPSGQSVDETLAETRYPTLLPYHFPHDQVELSLLSAGVPLEAIISQTSTDWPWFLSDALTGESSNSAMELASALAPEQQTLLTEPDNSTASDLTGFYKTNLGLNTADYTPFTDLSTFTRQLGITVPQVEKLIAGTAGGSSVVVSDNVDKTEYIASPDHYGATFINVNDQPVIVLGAPELGELHLSNTSYVEGKFGQGIQTRSTDDSYFYFNPEGEVAQTMKGDKSFTLGFWLYRNNYTTERNLIFSNAGDANSTAYSSGFYLSTDENNSNIAFVINDDKDKQIYNSWKHTLNCNSWYYIALCWDAETRNAYLYTLNDGSTVSDATITLNASSLGDITTAQGFTWAFNTRGDLTRNSKATDDTPDFIYDDIAVFDGALTTEEINTLATSGKPLAKTDISGFSADCIWNNSLDQGLNNLSDARMDRINRMVRLQRWLGLSYEETDLLLSACIRAQGADNPGYSLNADTLRMLGAFRHWQQKYHVSAFQFAAVLSQITPYAISPAVPFLDQVFNSPSLFDEPFAITGATVSYTDTTGDSARTVRQICAGLDITQAQFRVLADKVAAQLGDASARTFPLTLATVSALYRLVMLPRWLGLSFADGVALCSLLGQDDSVWTTLAGEPLLSATDSGEGDILDILMALEAAAQWAKEHSLSWVKNWLALQPESNDLVATAATVNFVNGIKQQLPAALLTEQSFTGVTLSEPNNMLSVPGGYTAVDSPLGNWHGILFNSTQGQYAAFPEAANTLANGSNSYTLGMWVKVKSGASVGFPVLANAAAYNQKTSSGIFIGLGSSYHLEISTVSDDGTTPVVTDTASTTWQADKWFWLGVANDSASQKLTVYAYSADGTITSSAALKYAGSILMPESNVWALSQNGLLNNTSTHATMSYDDITLWDSVLTTDNIATIVSSGKPATQTVAATLQLHPDSWTGALSDLIDGNGLVLPAATDYTTITGMVSADIDAAGIVFDSDADRQQAVDTLSGIISQARLTQNDIADSALAQMFSTAQSLPAFLLEWANDSEYRLLSDSLTMNSGENLTDPAQVTVAYLADLYALGQRAGITAAFSLTPATLHAFLAHPDWFGLSDTTLSLTLLYRFSRYLDCLTLAGREDAVLGYLAWVNAAAAPDQTDAAKALAALLDWESDEVSAAVAGLPGGMAKTVADVDYVMRLKSLSAESGLSVTPLLAVGALVPGSVTDTWSAWQSAGESLVAAQSGQQ
ncbi:Tc toxin subunit A [Pseudescherichia sp.]|uniref:Tc toxin subunit A n=1 Tax=Pseudescherichia sp. TaxID=2055881 RepID=UPI003917F7C0